MIFQKPLLICGFNGLNATKATALKILFCKII